jgi:hypothetical protein
MQYEEITTTGIEAVQIPFDLNITGIGAVKATDWIVSRGGKVEAYTNADFKAKFRPLGSGNPIFRAMAETQREFGGLHRTRNS